MKTIPVALQTSLESGVTTFALLMSITRRDGVVHRITNHDQNIVYGGNTYSMLVGYDANAMKSNGNMAVDASEVKGFLDVLGLTEADILAGMLDYAAIRVVQIDWANPANGEIIMRAGTLGQVDVASIQYVAEIRGLTQNLQQRIGETYSFSCRAEFGSQAPTPLIRRCGFNLATITVTGVVTSVENALKFADSGRTELLDHFALGVVTWTGGANTGYKKEVKQYLGAGQFVLADQMPHAIQVGDTYSVHPGCNKTPKACRDTYNWMVNFKGEPYVAGSDSLIRIGSAGGGSSTDVFQ